MSCVTCHGTGTYWISDDNGCVAKEPCDKCEVFNDRVRRTTNA